MARREVVVCDVCADEDKQTDARSVYLGIDNAWWSVDLCEAHEVSLLGDLEALLDSVGAPATGAVLGNVPR